MVVDCQYDFYNPEGTLYVGNGANTLPSRIENIINKFDGIVFTLDWHPSNHCSFNENGGQWPTHCVKYTKGASLPNVLLSETDDKNVLFVTKGKNKDFEEYSPFDDENNKRYIRFFIANQVKDDDTKVELYVCGLAGDICVYNTLSSITKAYQEYGNLFFGAETEVFAITDLCPTISPDFNMKEETEKVGAKTITSNELFKPTVVSF